MVEKRTIKISVAVMAIAALVMGLSIGLGQKNKNEKTSSASSLNTYQTYCDAGTGIAGGPTAAKAGKAPVAPKAEKSPTAPKAEKVDRRELIVPGTEDAAVALGSGKRRMMKEELLRGIKQRGLKSSKGGCGGGKSGKANVPCPPPVLEIECIAIKEVCANEGGGKSGKSGPTSPSEGKSGKSGPTSPSEGKSGKSGPTSPSEGKSGKSGPTSPSEGKSGKSGPTSPSEGKAGKASGLQSPTVCTAKSAKTTSCGKSGKSNGSNPADCAPTARPTPGTFNLETPAPSPLVSTGSSETVGKEDKYEGAEQGDRKDPWAP